MIAMITEAGPGLELFTNPNSLESVVAFSFFIGTMAMMGATAFFWLEMRNIDARWRTSLLVSGLITFIAAVHYYYMRGFYMETGQSPTFFRYVDWLLTVPLMAVEFYLITKKAGAKLGLLWKLIAASVAMLVLGGMVTTIIALNHVTPDGGVLTGLSHVYETAGDKFHMILKKSNPEFFNLPGIAVLIGGMWVANLYYWGFNQYIIQRTLAAKSLRESQRGIVFAAFLKMIIPIFVVVPGIIAWVMFSQPEGTTVIEGANEAFVKADGTMNYDKAYPWLISTFIPTGLKGLVVAALAAAIVSSLASMVNSTATIFTMDIYKPYFAKKDGKNREVVVGRLSGAVALIIAITVAPMLGNIEQAFQYIQEYTGLVSPGVLAVFLLGLFYKKTTNRGAITGILLSIPVALLLKIEAVELPWIDQMFYTCIITMAIIIMVSLSTNKNVDDPKGIELTNKTFKTGKAFNIGAYVIAILLVVLYAVFW
jgi:SSS family solute:Na+ symporter